MITSAPTEQMLKAWRALFFQYQHTLSPNKKTGAELLDYLGKKYALQEAPGQEARDIVAGNVTGNAFFAEKLPTGAAPLPVAFFVDDAGAGKALYESQNSIVEKASKKILVGVDLVAGYFLVEGSEELWDELCAFSGLDEKDLQNYVCVGLYLESLKKFGSLQDVLD